MFYSFFLSIFIVYVHCLTDNSLKVYSQKNKLSAIVFSEFPLQIEEAPSANFDQGCFFDTCFDNGEAKRKAPRDRLNWWKRATEATVSPEKGKGGFLFKQFRKLERSTFCIN